MTLRIREIFRTFQGEGSLVGSPAVFVRFSGCNLWNGLEDGRGNGKGQCARWCDTDFATGTSYDVDQAVEAVNAARRTWTDPLIVLTGGEPMLQLRKPVGIEFLQALAYCRWRIAIETNGTIEIPYEARAMIDHVTVSPKPILGDDVTRLGHMKVRHGEDLKVIWPSPFDHDELDALSRGFNHCFLQPMDPIVQDGVSNPRANLEITLSAAGIRGWRVSLQSHKLVDMP